MATFISETPLSKDHLSAIGRISVEWTLLEKAIALVVWELAGLREEQGHAVTTHIPTLTLIDMAKTLANEWLPNDPTEEKLKAHLGRIAYELRSKRNRAVHGLWGPAATEGCVALLETTARGVLKMKIGEEMTADDLLQVAADIDRARHELVSLFIEFRDARDRRYRA